MRNFTNHSMVIKLSFLLFIIPGAFLFAGGMTPQEFEDYQKMMQYLRGDGVIEKWFMEGFLAEYDLYMEETWGSYILFAQALAGIASLVYLGNKAFGILSGDQQWEVLPLLKPFLIGLVLANWVETVKLIKAPTDIMTEYSRDIFQETQVELDLLRVKRYIKQTQLMDAALNEKARSEAEISQIEQAGQTWVETGVDWIEDKFDDMLSPIYEFSMRINIELSSLAAQLFESIALLILRVCTYLIFFMQKVFTTVLIIIGPISLVASIFPGFSNSFSSWLHKFVGVQFYSIIGYIILRTCTVIQMFAFEAEIDRYEQMINEDGSIKNLTILLQFVTGGNLSFNMVLVAFVMSGIGMLMTPTLSAFVIGAGSATNQASGKMMAIGTMIATKGLSKFKK